MGYAVRDKEAVSDSEWLISPIQIIKRGCPQQHRIDIPLRADFGVFELLRIENERSAFKIRRARRLQRHHAEVLFDAAFSDIVQITSKHGVAAIATGANANTAWPPISQAMPLTSDTSIAQE